MREGKEGGGGMTNIKKADTVGNSRIQEGMNPDEYLDCVNAIE